MLLKFKMNFALTIQNWWHCIVYVLFLFCPSRILISQIKRFISKSEIHKNKWRESMITWWVGINGNIGLWLQLYWFLFDLPSWDMPDISSPVLAPYCVSLMDHFRSIRCLWSCTICRSVWRLWIHYHRLQPRLSCHHLKINQYCIYCYLL